MCINENVFLFMSIMLVVSCGLNIWLLCRQHQCNQWTFPPKEDELVYNFQMTNINKTSNNELPAVVVSEMN